MVLPERLGALRGFAGKDSVPEMNEQVRDVATAARVMPIGVNVMTANCKEILADCPGGEFMILAALPAGLENGKCTKTWCALLAVADKDGRVIVRGVKGAPLTTLIKSAEIDMSVEAGLPENALLQEAQLRALARQRAVDTLPSSDVDQAPPSRQLAGEARVLLEWAKDYVRQRRTDFVRPLAEGGGGLDASWLSLSGYFEAAPATVAASPQALALKRGLATIVARSQARASAAGSPPTRPPSGVFSPTTGAGSSGARHTAARTGAVSPSLSAG